MFDYNYEMGVCGVTNTGKRWACRFQVSNGRKMSNGRLPSIFPEDYLDAYFDKVAHAKTVIMDRLFSDKQCVEGDATMEGNEETI